MKHRLTCLLALLTVVQGVAQNIDNRNIDGYPIIIPAVQKMQKTGTHFTMPDTLDVSAPKEFDLSLLEKTLAEGGRKMLRTDSGQCRFVRTDRNVPANEEGYRLEITPNGIVVSAKTDHGLFNGMQSLRYILRNTSEKELKGCVIEDYPDLKIRAVFLECNSLDPEQVDALCRAIEVYSQLKYNTLLIDFGANFPLKNNPYTLRKKTLSLEDIKKIQKTARANHMDIIPFVQAVTHTFWMTHHPEFETKISEGKPRTPWCSSYCLSKPLPKKLILAYLDEVSDILKPRYFHIAMDELCNCPFQVCPECKKADPVELFGNHAKMLVDFLLKKGVTPIVAHDQFDPESPWFNSTVKPALDKLDRRTIVNIWDYNVNPNPKSHEYFNQKGFKVFYMSWSDRLENTAALPRMAAKDGSLGCVVTWWLSLPPTLEWRKPSWINSYASVIVGAADSWNATGPRSSTLAYDPIYEVKKLLDPKAVHDFSGMKASSIPLDGAVNARLGSNPLFPMLDRKGISVLEVELAKTGEKFKLDASGDEYFGIVLSGRSEDKFQTGPVTLPVDATAKGLSFLMAAAPWNDFAIHPHGKKALGKIRIEFADGKNSDIPLEYRINTNAWYAECGGYNMRTVNRGVEKRGARYSFYALDWKNPHPDKKIKSITFSVLPNTGIATGIFAVSALDSSYGMQGVAGKTPEKAPPAVKYEGNDAPTVLVDFEPGRQRNLSFSGSTKDRFASPLKFKTVDTPNGKMLEMQIPALGEGRAWGRVAVDIPIENTDFNTILFDCRFSNPEWIWRPDTYIFNPDKGGGDTCLCYERVPVHSGLLSYAIPREAYRGKEGGGFNPSEKASLRIAFFVTNPAPMKIWLGKVSTSKKALPWFRGIYVQQEDSSKNRN